MRVTHDKGLLRIALRRLRAIAQGCAVCLPLRDWNFERSHDVTSPARSLLPLPHVQFWETENSGRLDRSHRGSHRRDIPCLVDASDVRTLNAFKTSPAWSKSAISLGCPANDFLR